MDGVPISVQTAGTRYGERTNARCDTEESRVKSVDTQEQKRDSGGNMSWEQPLNDYLPILFLRASLHHWERDIVDGDWWVNTTGYVN